MCKISVIVPVYNKEDYIHECLDSVLNQTFKDFELIIVDDESPDNCPAICDQYAAKDSRIRVIHQKNKGHSGARNTGLMAAKGDFVFLVDGDDYIQSEKAFEIMIDCARNNNADIVLSKIAGLVNGIEILKDSVPDINYENLSALNVLCGLIQLNAYIPSMCSRLFNRELIVNNNLLFNISMHDDEEWTPKIFYYAQKACFADVYGYVRRPLETSVSGSKDEVSLYKKTRDKIILARNLIVFFRDKEINKYQRKLMFDHAMKFMNAARYSFYNIITDRKDKYQIRRTFSEDKRFLKYVIKYCGLKYQALALYLKFKGLS